VQQKKEATCLSNSLQVGDILAENVPVSNTTAAGCFTVQPARWEVSTWLPVTVDCHAKCHMTNNVLPVFFSLASQLLCSSGISCELYTRIDTLNQTCCAAVWSVQGRFTYVIMEKGYHIM